MEHKERINFSVIILSFILLIRAVAGEEACWHPFRRHCVMPNASTHPQATTSAAQRSIELRAAVNTSRSVSQDTQTLATKTTANPTVSLDTGDIIGTTTVMPSSTVVVQKFLGVPFAISPPVRFSISKPLLKEDSRRPPLIAQKFTSACMQTWSSQFLKTFFQGTGYPGDSEDCLHLNIYVPEGGSKNKTVLFWLYGGSLQCGTAMQDLYDGSDFAANQDVIVVAANYRLSVFGFSNSPEIPEAWQNVGFWDQRLALDWTRQNIAAFGGDPSKVTLFGESSGASSIDRLIASPPEPISFRAAITQSGQASVSAGGSGGNATAWNVLVEALQCGYTESPIACVRSKDAVSIQKIVNDSSLNFYPITDNITQLPLPVNRSLRQTVPFMTGTNGQEGRIFTLDNVRDTNVTRYLNSFPSANLPEFDAAITKAFPIPSPGIATAYDAISQIHTKLVLQCPAALVANESVAAGFPTWRYLYNATFPNINGSAALATVGLADLHLEATHTTEIPLVFGTYPRAGATEEEAALSKNMQKAWAGFAKDPYGVGPGWPRYGPRKGVINPVGVAGLGINGSPDVVMLRQGEVDDKCEVFAGLYSKNEYPLY